MPVAAFAPTPVAAPVSVPSVISAVPGAPARFTQAPDDDENIDETRHAPARAGITASRTGFRLAFDDGTSHVVTGRSLVGRNPAASNGEEVTALVALNDASKSLSKTHALLEQREGVLHVTDRHSTNGSRLIAADGRATALTPGEATAVPVGASVAFGDRIARIERS
jgi:pSer/pThr/pTyr-binding forkhead associated (FHA) protein